MSPDLPLRFRKALHGLGSRLGRRALRFGVGGTVEHDRILRSRPWRTVLDVGANRGQFALRARIVQPQARIYAFEPLPGPCETFRKVFEGAPGVTLFDCAVGPRTETARMNLSAHDDCSSLLPIGPEQTALFAGTGQTGVVPVKMDRLARLVSPAQIERPCLLKLDVQGFELAALEGCQELLDQVDAIYVELSFCELYVDQPLFDEVAEYLRARGFQLADIGSLLHLRRRLVQGDFLFARAAATVGGATGHDAGFTDGSPAQAYA